MEDEAGLVYVTELRDPSGTLVVSVRGELDMSGRDSVEPILLAAIATGTPVLVDLRELTFCDSSGIALFVAASEKAKAEGTVLSLRHVQPHVRRIFEITGVATMFDVVE